MQRVVSHQGYFTDIYIWWPGRVCDARVFADSSLYKRSQSKTLLPDWKDNIGEKDIPLIMFGDPVYPWSLWFMKTFTDNGHLSHEQKQLLNHHLSRARVDFVHYSTTWPEKSAIDVHLYINWTLPAAAIYSILCDVNYVILIIIFIMTSW